MKKFLVYGIGISGNATIKSLLERGFEVIVSDDSRALLDNLKQTLLPESNLKIINNIQEINWQNIECLILAAGIPLKYPLPNPIVVLAQRYNCKIVCDVEMLYLFNQLAKFIGITGTNGKSTTTALTHHIFQLANKKSFMGGNIGIGALALPDLSQNESYILEISSYQLDLIKKTRFNIASLINITPDHLDRHKNMAGYIESKKKIFVNQQVGDFAIINIDNTASKTVFEELKNNSLATLIPISTKKIVQNGVSIIGNIIYNNIDNKKSIIDLGERLFLKGEHNAQNIAFAFANCFLSNITEEKIVMAIKTFEGLKHRMQLVKKIDNINLVNDSKATNADSSENALKSFDNIYWILGGRSKDGGIESLQKYFSKIKFAFLIGEATEQFAKTLEGKVSFLRCKNLETAFKKAFEKASCKTLDNSTIESKVKIRKLKSEGDKEKTILFSPSCASFDQWKNFEERGNFFIKLAVKLKPII
jgi:UDP-N-acetylmuramoylalanine--D-glutamate ligase